MDDSLLLGFLRAAKGESIDEDTVSSGVTPGLRSRSKPTSRSITEQLRLQSAIMLGREGADTASDGSGSDSCPSADAADPSKSAASRRRIAALAARKRRKQEIV